MGGIVGDYTYLLGNKIKPAGQLVSGSKESGITPITGFDAKLILVRRTINRELIVAPLC